MESFSLRLQHAMDEKEIRAKELCEMTGIGKSAMSQYMNGAITPKHDRISAIAKALDVCDAWLSGFDVEKERWDDGSGTHVHVHSHGNLGEHKHVHVHGKAVHDHAHDE
ncbi:MAG: helix-turn-helix domain-containing protein [Clostridiales Family XIII bacterium]|jgi:transcriptional regulator with XRE-family HTH domain|nr:helix-turn-helix domain-containing protein [Clostridiales Family XIII bacterium]